MTLLVAPRRLAHHRPAGTGRLAGVGYRDSDPVRFWTYLIAALRTVLPHVGERRWPRWAIAAGVPHDAALPALINDLAALDDHVHLVLDDYHLLTDPELHRSVAYLLAHQPPRLHVAPQ